MPVEGCVAAPPPPRRLEVGACVRSSLDEQDDSVDGVSEVNYEDYLLPLAAGEAVRIDMDALPRSVPANAESSAEEFGFDTYLEIRAAGEGDALNANDDREDSLNSTLLFVAPERRTYIVRATSYLGGTGEYVLRVRNVRPPPTPRLLESLMPGRLAPEEMSGEWADPTARGARYAIEGVAGERVRVGLDSTIPNAFLAIYDSARRRIGSATAPEGSEDLVAILPETGTYLVQLTAADLAEAHDYRLELDRAANVTAPAVPAPIAIGARIQGGLTLDSPAQVEPRSPARSYFYRLYELPVEAGTVITVEMASAAFTPVIEAGSMSVLGFATAADSSGMTGRAGTRTAGMRTNARLELRPERSGIIHLRARSRGLHVGDFTLQVSAR